MWAAKPMCDILNFVCQKLRRIFRGTFGALAGEGDNVGF